MRVKIKRSTSGTKEKMRRKNEENRRRRKELVSGEG